MTSWMLWRGAKSGGGKEPLVSAAGRWITFWNQCLAGSKALPCGPLFDLPLLAEPPHQTELQQQPARRESKRLFLFLAPAVQLQPPSPPQRLPAQSWASKRLGCSPQAPGAVCEESRAAAAKRRARSCGTGHRPIWAHPTFFQGAGGLMGMSGSSHRGPHEKAVVSRTWASLGLLMSARPGLMRTPSSQG